MYEAIGDGGNDVFVSVVSAFEISTKKSIGKLKAPDDLREQAQASAFTILPLMLDHALAAGELPLHHGDPFDRLLVGQARCDGLTLVTGDRALSAYQVSILPAWTDCLRSSAPHSIAERSRSSR